jgi:flagellar biosynthesis/type III secretory pathway M-ring protein FliF/YscJ
LPAIAITGVAVVGIAISLWFWKERQDQRAVLVSGQARWGTKQVVTDLDAARRGHALPSADQLIDRCPVK